MAMRSSGRMRMPTVLRKVNSGITIETLSVAIQQIKGACYEKLRHPR
jgi:hypothetical protein